MAVPPGLESRAMLVLVVLLVLGPPGLLGRGVQLEEMRGRQLEAALVSQPRTAVFWCKCWYPAVRPDKV